MKKQPNLVKNKKAFILLETIISLCILAIVVSLMYKLTYHKSYIEKFELLNKIENSFTSKNYDDFSKYNIVIHILKNNVIKRLDVKKVVYDKNGITLYKYELYK